MLIRVLSECRTPPLQEEMPENATPEAQDGGKALKRVLLWGILLLLVLGPPVVILIFLGAL